tara:strand:- start:1760 stop:1993 length:234 start_codon:yes stop_codon:yes gene_type:complete
MPKKKEGLALMILSKGKKESKDMDEEKEALMAACSAFAGAMGVELSAEREEEACEALLDFVHIAMDYDGPYGEEEED